MSDVFITYPYFRRVNGTTLYRSSNPVYSVSLSFKKVQPLGLNGVTKSSLGAFSGSCKNDTYRFFVFGVLIMTFKSVTHESFDKVIWSGTEKNINGDILLEEYGNDRVGNIQRMFWKIKSLAYQQAILKEGE